MDKSMKNQEWFEQCVKESQSIFEAITRIGHNTPSNFYKIFYKYAEKYNTDISHFSNKKFLNKKHNPYSLEEILIEGFSGSISGTTLKKKLYENKIKQPICELCKQDENWVTGKISMILDHINGNNKDNRIENLRIVCPNCDATLSTYKGKNKKRKKEILTKEENINYISKIELKNNYDSILNLIDNTEKKKGWKINIYKNLKWSITKFNNFLLKYRPDLLNGKKPYNKYDNLKSKIEIINNNLENIKFEDKGWTVRVSKLLNITPQYSRKLIIKYFPLIYKNASKHIS